MLDNYLPADAAIEAGLSAGVLNIVVDEADLDTCAAGLDAASFMNNGQTCTLQSRILAPRARYDEVVDAVRITLRRPHVERHRPRIRPGGPQQLPRPPR